MSDAIDRDAVRDEVEYRLRTAAAHYRSCGKHDTDPGDFLDREIEAMTERLVGLLAPAPLREEVLADEPEPWRCPGCNSDRWIRASLTRGLSVITQCVPCGRYVNCPPPDRAEGDGRVDR